MLRALVFAVTSPVAFDTLRRTGLQSMLLTLRVTGPNASDLSVLLGQFPDKLHTANLPFGLVHVFFPELTSDAVTAALLVDVGAVGWSSNECGGGFAMANAAMLSVAIANVLGAALVAHCPDKPALVTASLPLEVGVTVFTCPRGIDDAKALFAPLGYAVEVTQSADDVQGCGYTVRLSKSCPLYEILSHLYVLGPVLEGRVGDRVLDEEVGEILLHAEGFVRGHPEAERILHAYAARKPSGVHAALTRLLAIDAADPKGEIDAAERPASSQLDDARIDAIVAALRGAPTQTVLDLGCGDGKLLARLVREKALTRIVGVDISHGVLDAAAARMKLDRRGGKKSERIELVHGSLFYKDHRLTGFDAAVLADVVQFVDAGRLGALERVVFEHVQPSTLVVLMTNAGATASSEQPRHHRWTTNEFDMWSNGVSERRKYRVRFSTIGSANPARMAVFSR